MTKQKGLRGGSKLANLKYKLWFGERPKDTARKVQYTDMEHTRKISQTPTDTLKKLHNRETPPTRGTPAHFQQRAISREFKKRGIAEAETPEQMRHSHSSYEDWKKACEVKGASQLTKQANLELYHDVNGAVIGIWNHDNKEGNISSHANENTEATHMATMVELVESKNALGFKTMFEAKMHQKLDSVLEAYKSAIANSLFEEEEEEEEERTDPEGGNFPAAQGQDPLKSVSTEIPGQKKIVDQTQGKNVDKDEVPANASVAESNWLQGAVHPDRAGMFKGRSLSSLESQKAKLAKTEPHKRGSAAATKTSQLNFAIRAKEGHGFKKS
jgi:hypothetical protein